MTVKYSHNNWYKKLGQANPAKDTRDYPFRDLRKEMLSMPGVGEIVVRIQSGSKR